MALVTSSPGGEKNGLRGLPSVDKVLAEPALADTLEQYKRDIVVEAVRARLPDRKRRSPCLSPFVCAGRMVLPGCRLSLASLYYADAAR